MCAWAESFLTLKNILECNHSKTLFCACPDTAMCLGQYGYVRELQSLWGKKPRQGEPDTAAKQRCLASPHEGTYL